jgi:hypothetical protein
MRCEVHHPRRDGFSDFDTEEFVESGCPQTEHAICRTGDEHRLAVHAGEAQFTDFAHPIALNTNAALVRMVDSSRWKRRQECWPSSSLPRRSRSHGGQDDENLHRDLQCDPDD